MYLVHSYYVPLIHETVAETNYGGAYGTALQKDNFFGYNFTPKKVVKLEVNSCQFYHPMRIIPAIDIINGKCVRLSKGDYSTQKIYNEAPLEVAKAFEDHGIQNLHLVDLDE